MYSLVGFLRLVVIDFGGLEVIWTLSTDLEIVYELTPDTLSYSFQFLFKLILIGISYFEINHIQFVYKIVSDS